MRISLDEAIVEAKAHNDEYQPAYGTEVVDARGDVVWSSETESETESAESRYYALVGDVTKDRATVRELLDDADAAAVARKRVGIRLDLAVVDRGKPMEVGERIWIGQQSIDTVVL